LTGGLAALSAALVGHLVWAGALLAFTLELHSNRGVAFSRPAAAPPQAPQAPAPVPDPPRAQAPRRHIWGPK
jgi:hypothetical protein